VNAVSQGDLSGCVNLKMDLQDDEMRPYVRLANKVVKFDPTEECGPRAIAYAKTLRAVGAEDSPGKQRLTAAARLPAEKWEQAMEKVAPSHANPVNPAT